jgi:hypothetical protein
MIRDDPLAAGYRYAGESIELDDALTDEQYTACADALGWQDGRRQQPPDAAGRRIEPQTLREAHALRAHLRQHDIPHTYELALTWTPEDREHPATQAVADLLALARRLGLPEGALDEALYDAEAPSASQINNEGLEAQLRWLLDVNSPDTVRTLIIDAAARDREVPLDGSTDAR